MKMAVVPQNRSIFESSNSLTDITSDLQSLQFESSLPPDQKKYLFVRKKLRAITIAACAHGTYFTSICNEVRRMQLLAFEESDDQNSVRRNALSVGIIGCGRLGCLLAHCLLTFAELKADQLLISTRRPEILVDLQQRGVTCCYDNVRIASAVDILFLCILPSQLQQVVDGIKEHLRNESIIYSFIPTIPRQKICALLSHQFVIQTEYEWNESCDADTIITDSLDIVQALENDSVLLLSCPLGSALKVPQVDETLCGQWTYAFTKMCTFSGLSKNEIVDALNTYVLGLSKPHTKGFTLPDLRIVKPANSSQSASLFNWQRSELWRKFQNNESIRSAYVSRYLNIFKQRLNWQHVAKTTEQSNLHITYEQ